MEYRLITPIKKVTGEEIETVEIKEVFTGRDLKAIGKAGNEGDGAVLISLVAAAINQSENTVLNMNSKDIRKIGELAKPFFIDGED